VAIWCTLVEIVRSREPEQGYLFGDFGLKFAF
jgi:hypothetical protein